jgi:dTDP-4-amino-4,6-dideoxygalactose transaminase
VHFRPLHRFSWFAQHALRAPGGLPISEQLADHVLSLPLHAELRADQVDRVVDALVAAVS